MTMNGVSAVVRKHAAERDSTDDVPRICPGLAAAMSLAARFTVSPMMV